MAVAGAPPLVVVVAGGDEGALAFIMAVSAGEMADADDEVDIADDDGDADVIIEAGIGANCRVVGGGGSGMWLACGIGGSSALKGSGPPGP